MESTALGNIEIPEAPKAVPSTPKPAATAKVKAKAALASHPRLTKTMKKITKAKPARKTSPKAKKASKAVSGTKCKFCGKPLSRHTSVENGMGDICAVKKKLLGGRSIESHYENITETEVPKGHIKLKDAIKKAKQKAGVSRYRFIWAIGGDRMLRKPLNSHFKVVIVKNVRYLPASSLTHLKDLEKVG